MRQFMVLVEKEYKVGTYVPVLAETDAEAYQKVNAATQQVRRALLETELNEQIVGRFGQIEQAIDELGEDLDFLLNGPSETHQGVMISFQDQWSRPVVVEGETATAAA